MGHKERKDKWERHIVKREMTARRQKNRGGEKQSKTALFHLRWARTNVGVEQLTVLTLGLHPILTHPTTSPAISHVSVSGFLKSDPEALQKVTLSLLLGQRVEILPVLEGSVQMSPRERNLSLTQSCLGICSLHSLIFLSHLPVSFWENYHFSLPSRIPLLLLIP